MLSIHSDPRGMFYTGYLDIRVERHKCTIMSSNFQVHSHGRHALSLPTSQAARAVSCRSMQCAELFVRACTPARAGCVPWRPQWPGCKTGILSGPTKDRETGRRTRCSCKCYFRCRKLRIEALHQAEAAAHPIHWPLRAELTHLAARSLA